MKLTMGRSKMGPFLLLVITCIQASTLEVDSNDKHVNLHNMMTVDEMKEYLETDTEHDIPEYQAIKLSSVRSKRSASRSGKLYSLTSFDTDMHLDLTTLSNTISDHGVIVQRRNAGGVHEETYRPDGEMYHGHVTGDRNSRVAVHVSKDGKELSGSIFIDGHVYKIQPMNKRLRDKANLHGDGHHVISKRKLRKTLFEKVEASKVLKAAKIRTRRSDDVTLTGPRIIELMITIDKPTYDFYGNQTLDYVLNVANMVNRLYKDPSMGFDLSVVLTKVFIIQHYEPALDIQANQIDSAVGYMIKFREWGVKMSDLSPPAAPGHFDHASLLSRHICGTSSCALDGVAYSGYPCNKHLSFNVNEARGLQAAFTITHEMAHNIGLGHDEGDCSKGFIMNGGQAPGPNSFRWSPCSSMKMKEIMSRETCYSDKPATSYPVPTRYPGYIYDADTQCKMAYDSTYTICPVTKNKCDQLFCMKGGGCFGKGAAPLDGTPCGQRKWCIRGSCVDIGNDLPPPIDGQWGSWSHYTSCSRPCGGGVRYRKRYCDSPSPQYMGKPCEGPSEGQPEICNPQDCAIPSDPRLEECIKRGVNRTYYKANNPCTLYCRIGNTIRIHGNVLDGTPCHLDQDKKDVCIKGQCRRVGCDSVLESGNELDRCRKCGGNGRDCVLVKLPDYTKDYRNYGPAKPDVMFTIPAGAMNVKIQELQKTNNVISVKESSSSSAPYLIPVPSNTMTVKAAGTAIKHIMYGMDYAEIITIGGPTTKPLYAMFIWVGFVSNPGFSCQYYIAGKGQATQYVWKVVKGSYCDVTCAGGTRINHVTCHRADDDTNVGIQYCDQATKPAKYESCNTQPCAPRWAEGDWTLCSRSCSGGQQTRSVTCQQKISQSKTVTLEESYCGQSTKPSNQQACNQYDCPPEWITTPWSECSAQCGGGTKTRTVSCKKTLLTQATLSLNDSSCATEVGYKPPTTEHCNTMDCYVWTHDYSCDGCRGYRHLGCFGDTGDRALPQLIKYNLQVSTAFQECYQAAITHGYSVFGVQNENECWSSATGEQTYNKHGSSTLCKNGLGGAWSNDVYKIASEKSYQAIGCFKDSRIPSRRPLPNMFANHRNSIDWKNINKTVAECSVDAWDDGFPVFGVQFYGECWSGRLGYQSYSADGVSTSGCWKGVGGDGANYVYAFDGKVVKTSITCRHIIANAAVSQDHCKQTKPDPDLRLCEQACKN